MASKVKEGNTTLVVTIDGEWEADSMGRFLRTCSAFYTLQQLNLEIGDRFKIHLGHVFARDRLTLEDLADEVRGIYADTLRPMQVRSIHYGSLGEIMLEGGAAGITALYTLLTGILDRSLARKTKQLQYKKLEMEVENYQVHTVADREMNALECEKLRLEIQALRRKERFELFEEQAALFDVNDEAIRQMYTLFDRSIYQLEEMADDGRLIGVHKPDSTID